MIALQAASPAIGPPQLMLWVLILVIFYFFFIRPNSKKRKDQEAFEEELTKGKEVVTISGMIGKINKVEGNIVQLQVDQKTFIKVLKTSISKDMTAGLTVKSNDKEEA